jgi:hypothetical protein
MILNILLIVTCSVFVGFLYAWNENGFLDLITILLLFIWVFLLIGGVIIAKLGEKKIK